MIAVLKALLRLSKNGLLLAIQILLLHGTQLLGRHIEMLFFLIEHQVPRCLLK